MEYYSIMRTIKQQIVAGIKARKLTVLGLAYFSGVCVDTIRDVLAERNIPSGRIMQKLATALGRNLIIYSERKAAK